MHHQSFILTHHRGNLRIEEYFMWKVFFVRLLRSLYHNQEPTEPHWKGGGVNIAKMLTNKTKMCRLFIKKIFRAFSFALKIPKIADWRLNLPTTENDWGGGSHPPTRFRKAPDRNRLSDHCCSFHSPQYLQSHNYKVNSVICTLFLHFAFYISHEIKKKYCGSVQVVLNH